ncbi:hypothetical protein Bca4012_049725 [Brassica carinata]|uniref:Uncharacterized protein n=1 Tax=Brassica carinata TaxID=52824 RepID=A0A8X7R7B6_BRACI|nr:hypothetical protein Bca52824_052473 [Brassica carinata]
MFIPGENLKGRGVRRSLSDMVDENDRAEDRGDDSKDTKSDHQRETSDDQIHRCLNAYYPHQL